ncbi:MAG: translocation/assembly module TamB domain-containing protein [Gammaproteobacteria bacterium]
MLLVFVLLFAALAGTTLFVATTEAGAQWVLARVDAAAGGKLNWAQANGTLMDGMRIADVVFDGGDSLLRIQRVEFAWQPWRLLDGSLVLDRVDIAGLQQQTRVASDEVMTEERLRELLFGLPVAIELRAFRADDIEVMRPDGTMTAIETVTGAAELDGDALMLRDVTLRQGDAQVAGDLQLSEALMLAGEIDWQLQNGGRSYEGSLMVAGTLQRPELVHELMQPLRATSNGTVLSGLFDGAMPRFDLQHEVPSQTLAVVEQPDLQVSASVRTVGTADAVAIEGNAQAQVPAFAPLDIGFALDWRDAALVIREATVDSAQIGLRGSGLLETAPLGLRFDWMLDSLDAGDQLPQLQLADVSGSGSVQVAESDGAFAGALQVDALTGTINGYPLSVSGRADAAAGAAAATLELQAASGANTFGIAGTVGDDIAVEWNLALPEPGALWQGLAGSLEGSGSIAGTRAAPQVNGSLDGALRLARGAEVFALDALTLSASYGVDSNDVELELGRITRAVDGATTVLLQRGTLTLSGTPAQHRLRTSLEAPADALQLDVQGAFADGDWQGTIQRAELASRAGDWTLEAPASLSYVNGAVSLAQNCWRYAQTALCLQGGMTATRGVDAELALTEFPLTWLNTLATAPATKPAALQQLQDAFQLNLPDGVRTEGLLDASITLRKFSGGTWDSLDAELQPRGFVVEITQQAGEEEAEPLKQRFGFGFERIEAQARGADWAGALDVSIRQETDGRGNVLGTLRGSGELAADGSLSGSADFAFRDLAWLESFGPMLRSPAGMLNGTIGVGGTREQPRLQASMQLQNGSFDVPQYGLAIRDATLMLDTDAANVLRLEASARSGDGQLQLSAEARDPLQANRSVNLELNGADFVAMMTEYASVTLTPRLTGSFADELLTVNGSIDVHDTEVDLEGLFGAGGENAVGVSSDVVIVSGEQEMAGDAEQDALRIAANVDVRIGDAVHVSGYDLDATLGGELRIEQTPGRPVLVYGELDIPEGRYEIYNQELNARDGRLVFFGNPANPLLDVRAFRELESGEVGVHLTGNLDSIQGRLYSTPALPDNEALALLVTGKSFGNVNQAESDALVGAIASFGLRRGEGFTERVGSSLGLDTFTVGAGTTLEDSALGLGKYLTPELLMRYKLGLFDRQSVLGIEYKLTERLKLEVETGISQSVDLNYTIEKD